MVQPEVGDARERGGRMKRSHRAAATDDAGIRVGTGGVADRTRRGGLGVVRRQYAPTARRRTTVRADPTACKVVNLSIREASTPEGDRYESRMQILSPDVSRCKDRRRTRERTAGLRIHVVPALVVQISVATRPCHRCRGSGRKVVYSHLWPAASFVQTIRVVVSVRDVSVLEAWPRVENVVPVGWILRRLSERVEPHGDRTHAGNARE